MPEPGWPARALAAAASVGLAAAIAVGLRALAGDEPLSDRMLQLMLVSAIGGVAAALPAAALLARIGGGWRRIPRALIGGLSTGLLFIPATLAVFAFDIRIVDGRIEGDLASGFASGDIVFSLIGAMGMFTPTGLRYLAPWPLAAVTLVAGIAVSRWPRPAG